MKFRGHETFYLRQGWITKGLRNIIERPNLFYLDKKEQTDFLGVGTNMVKALRYWLETFNLIEMATSDRVKIHKLTDFGKVVWEHDKYIQEEGTLWLLHYYLVSNFEKATSWYWLFNEYTVAEFTKEDFAENIKTFIKVTFGSAVASRSISDDFQCIIKTYLSEISELESNMYSPLSELKLLREDGKGYKFSKSIIEIEDEIIMFTILDQYNKSDYQNDSLEINIERLNVDKGNIAKTYKLNWNNINQYLDNLHKKGYLKVTRTSGLDVINLTTKKTHLEILSDFYESNEGTKYE